MSDLLTILFLFALIIHVFGFAYVVGYVKRGNKSLTLSLISQLEDERMKNKEIEKAYFRVTGHHYRNKSGSDVDESESNSGSISDSKSDSESDCEEVSDASSSSGPSLRQRRLASHE